MLNDLQLQQIHGNTKGSYTQDQSRTHNQSIWIGKVNRIGTRSERSFFLLGCGSLNGVNCGMVPLPSNKQICVGFGDFQPVNYLRRRIYLNI
jgi:hypothetical protein